MNFIFTTLTRAYDLYGKRTVWAVLALFVVLLVVAIWLGLRWNVSVDLSSEIKKTEVQLRKVSEINFVSDFTTVGQVQAVSEARLQTEVGGRVTAVNTEIGKTVNAGFVIASIENSAERASLLQAEGAYEAAVAAAASSGISVEAANVALTSAVASAITTYQSTYITVESIVHNDVDELFQIENGKAIGFKLDASGQAPTLNSERTALEGILLEWGLNKNNASKDNIQNLLNTANTDTLRLAVFVDKLSAIVADQDTTEAFNDSDKNLLEIILSNNRQDLNGTLQQIETTATALTNAKWALEQATLAGSAGQSSAASAQVKIALGALRSAQANYEKTLVRTPIGGIVNALYLKAGEYVTPSQPAAIVANNNGLEILTSVSEADRNKITIGESVYIDETTTGTIGAIAGAVDPTTGKVAVKVAIEDNSLLKNGSTVTIKFAQSTTETPTEIIIPLSAIKMTGSGPIAFKVNNEQKLEAITVKLGAIQGDSVVIESGLTFDTVLVLDARGLKAGQEVTIKLE